ncbi:MULTISPECIES: NF038130 family PEP-CTERM protein [Nostocales]|uniref:PEP-CTERM sorting domain-containing protein n=3 Tax=Nostocales TaxID=1161 RepID=A0A0C1QUL8_9CYAN|nr:NF038130 family PEP-CTERM protein [Tolypothrix bouteillei]KAF3889053.1 PEP-CTERM sorting domain-containing protein [Tolypothrix bouteillei VB521301]
MKTLINKFLIGASIAAGVSAIVASPASAGSLTNASIGGTAASDYYVYGVKDGKTTQITSNLSNVTKVLDGDATSPTGNVELRASSEKAGFDFTKNTELKGIIGGRDITLSSLTKSDWESKDAQGVTLAKRWFDGALGANGFGSLLNLSAPVAPTKPAGMSQSQYINSTPYKAYVKAKLAYDTYSGVYNAAWGMFNTDSGLARFSDPNISYVNQDATGLIKIGLAGHYDATSLLFSGVDQTLINSLRDPNKVGTPIQASEIVKYTYDGKTDYLYSFNATNSGLVSDDSTKSHNGNYEVSIQGKPPVKSTPEPSVMLGMLVVGGMFATQRKLKKA